MLYSEKPHQSGQDPTVEAGRRTKGPFIRFPNKSCPLEETGLIDS